MGQAHNTVNGSHTNTAAASTLLLHCCCILVVSVDQCVIATAVTAAVATAVLCSRITAYSAGTALDTRYTAQHTVHVALCAQCIRVLQSDRNNAQRYILYSTHCRSSASASSYLLPAHEP
eukprot:13494-Heterococcus_DN1.PRE.5